MNKNNEFFQFDFERLNVYQKAPDFVDAMFEAHKALFQDFKYSVGGNLIRAVYQ